MNAGKFAHEQIEEFGEDYTAMVSAIAVNEKNTQNFAGLTTYKFAQVKNYNCQKHQGYLIIILVVTIFPIYDLIFSTHTQKK